MDFLLCCFSPLQFIFYPERFPYGVRVGYPENWRLFADGSSEPCRPDHKEREWKFSYMYLPEFQKRWKWVLKNRDVSVGGWMAMTDIHIRTVDGGAVVLYLPRQGTDISLPEFQPHRRHNNDEGTPTAWERILEWT